MTREERMRYEHQQMHEKHKGHEAMHAEMMIILLLTVVVAQVALYQWRKRHYRSYSVRTPLKFMNFYQDLVRFLVDNITWTMANPDCDMYKKSVVALHFFLDTFFMYNWTSHA